MNKYVVSVLASLISATLYSQAASASLAQQCMFGIPTFTPSATSNAKDQPVTITADNATTTYPNGTLFTGDVDIRQGDSTMTAKSVRLEQESKDPKQSRRVATATGDVTLLDENILLRSPKIKTNLDTKDIDILKGEYQFVNRQGRGIADSMQMREQNRYTYMKNGSFTSCLPGDKSWNIVGSEITLDREEMVAEIWHARLHIADVPVFYFPYLQLPVGDQRRSGFLMPTASYHSRNGFEFSQPYYWNIAPQMDATLTPHSIGHRGVLLENEFRYLLWGNKGTLAFDWLPNDRLYKRENPNEDNARRWLFYWKNSTNLGAGWRFDADYTKVSDDKYFKDFDSEYGEITDGYVSQKFALSYNNQNWRVKLSSKQFQLFTEEKAAYRTMPQLDINLFGNDMGPFDLNLYGQVARFENAKSNQPKATRWHLEPTITLPLSNGWASMTLEGKVLATHYAQDLNGYNATGKETQPKESVNRLLPQLKADAQMTFDRDMWFIDGYTQTLEPRIQYLYVPYKDQSNIHIYDTSYMQSDYNGLFRSSSYSGLDRIASQNRFATGVTSRIYDENLMERFNASLGQIYYLKASRTGDKMSIIEQNSQNGSTVWAADSSLMLNNKISFKSGIQYDTRLKKVALGDATFEYRQDEDRLVQLSYRYAAPEYIKGVLNYDGNTPKYQKGISQLGVIASWPIMDRLAVVGAYYHDFKLNHYSDQWFGLQYSTCCWSVGTGIERRLMSWNKESQAPVFDNKISFTLELRGLTTTDHRLGSAKMLDKGILPYIRSVD